MADFNGADINAMRQDAIRRAREMQSRSQSYVNGKPQQRPPDSPPRSGTNPPQGNPRREEQGAPCRNASPNPCASSNPCMNSNRQGASTQGNCPNGGAQKSSPLSGILNQLFPGLGIKLDEDRIILVILIILLAREGADLKLLLALGYLLM